MLQIISLLLPGLLIAAGIGAAINDNDDPDIDRDLTGTPGDDTLTGGSGNDDIDGGAGSDLLQGAIGNDDIHGGLGNDLVQGQSGNDTVAGEDGGDLVFGGDGNDTVLGGEGNDWVEGGDGDDLVIGGDDIDFIVGGEGADTLQGRSGIDFLIGGRFLDPELTEAQQISVFDGATWDGAVGASPSDPLIITDDGDADTLDGGSGSDALVLGSGDTGTGGTGADLFQILYDNANADEAVVTDFTSGTDTVAILTPAGTPPPTITLQTDGSDMLVDVDGEILARVTNAAATLTLADITVINGLTYGDF